jgi:hypothetical protein
MKCSGSRTRVRRREALWRSRSTNSLEPLSYSTVAAHQASVDSHYPVSVFEALIDIEPWRSCVYVGASSWSLDLFVNPLVIGAGWDTPC